jgi:nitroreductase
MLCAGHRPSQVRRLARPVGLANFCRPLLWFLKYIEKDLGGWMSSRDSEDWTATYPEKPAPADHPIAELMDRRWSPRLFEDRMIEREKMLSLLEAARWAPSCFNEQPWRFLVFDQSDGGRMERARACLSPGNSWALKAPVLLISVARDNFTRNEKINRTAQHDVGLATENLLLQVIELGLAAHAMAGFDTEMARREFNIAEGFTVLAMIAIGYPYRGRLDQLDEKTRERETAARERKPIGEIAFNGAWGEPYESR